MPDNLKIGENRIEDIRNPDGTFKKGTKIGCMKKKGFTLTDLNKLIRKYEKVNGELLLKHYIAQLFKDNRLLEKYIDKNVPTKNELTGPGGGPITHYIIEKTYDKPKEEETEKKDAI